MAGEIQVGSARVFQHGAPEDEVRELATLVNQILLGASNAYRNISLDLNATETVVTLDTARPGAMSIWQPSNAAAAAETGIYATVQQGQITVHHLSSAVERTGEVLLVG